MKAIRDKIWVFTLCLFLNPLKSQNFVDVIDKATVEYAHPFNQGLFEIKPILGYRREVVSVSGYSAPDSNVDCPSENNLYLDGKEALIRLLKGKRVTIHDCRVFLMNDIRGVLIECKKVLANGVDVKKRLLELGFVKEWKEEWGESNYDWCEIAKSRDKKLGRVKKLITFEEKGEDLWINIRFYAAKAGKYMLDSEGNGILIKEERKYVGKRINVIAEAKAEAAQEKRGLQRYLRSLKYRIEDLKAKYR